MWPQFSHIFRLNQSLLNSQRIVERKSPHCWLYTCSSFWTRRMLSFHFNFNPVNDITSRGWNVAACQANADPVWSAKKFCKWNEKKVELQSTFLWALFSLEPSVSCNCACLWYISVEHFHSESNKQKEISYCKAELFNYVLTPMKYRNQEYRLGMLAAIGNKMSYFEIRSVTMLSITTNSIPKPICNNNNNNNSIIYSRQGYISMWIANV